MKRFFTLMRWEYSGMFWPLCAIVGMMAALQTFFFYTAARDAAVFTPFSHLLEAARVSVFFAIACGALLALIGVRMVMHFWPTKSMYALLTLPGGRGPVYLAKLAAYLLAAAVLLAAQMALFLLFDLMANMLLVGLWYDGVSPVAPVIARRGADLFLSLLEIPLLRTLFPSGVFSVAVSAVAIGGTVCVAFFVAAALKSKRITATVISSAIWIILLVIAFPLTESTANAARMMFIFMILTAFVCTRMGMVLFEDGEVSE